MFYDDDRVLYLSMHRHDDGTFFPGTGKVEMVSYHFSFRHLVARVLLTIVGNFVHYSVLKMIRWKTDLMYVLLENRLFYSTLVNNLTVYICCASCLLTWNLYLEKSVIFIHNHFLGHIKKQKALKKTKIEILMELPFSCREVTEVFEHSNVLRWSVN